MRKSALILSAALTLVLAGPVFAASGGGGSGTQTCKNGQVWDKKKKKCVQANSQIFPDSELTEQAWALARKGDFEAGRQLFELVADKNKPEVLNGLGYTNRKLGQFDQAIAYYNQAIALDPNYAEAREYLGEGYVVLGKLDLAKEQLAEIKRICGTACEEYAELNEAIEEAVKQASGQ
ncbi:MAG TPA: tetratricopeptide repeat protein [Aestuariivirgaceae bacterium]|jgi:tetratricopeptide (TPR) repeat protein